LQNFRRRGSGETFRSFNGTNLQPAHCRTLNRLFSRRHRGVKCGKGFVLTVRPKRILVVEDEALILMATLDMLRELGHEPLPARCAGAAIALQEKGMVDALLTDVNLPDMDGQLLAAEIRRRNPGLPIVFATGYRLNLADAVAAGGPTAVLSKPYRTRDLADALRKVLGSATAEA
jgi:CheY-like chemotaxis protein